MGFAYVFRMEALNTIPILPHREIFWVAGLIYVLACAFGLQSLWVHRRYSRPVMLGLMGIGWLVQTWAMGQRGQLVGGCPLGNLFELLQFVVWSLVLLYFLVGPAFRMSLLGFFAAALAALLGVGSLLVPTWDYPYRVTERFFGTDPLVEAHASLAVFSYGVFALLAMVACMYFIQHWGLKHRKSEGIFSLLPSILQMDQIAYRLLIIGLAVLSISFACGIGIYTEGQQEVNVMKLVVTGGVWGAYLFLLVLRWREIYVGLSFARWCIILFAIALLSLWPVDSATHSQTGGEASSYLNE
ncbi:MAG: cytochrome c biogenesis protein CcsA [Verrucomicrobiota bacterium]